MCQQHELFFVNTPSIRILKLNLQQCAVSLKLALRTIASYKSWFYRPFEPVTFYGTYM